MNGPELLASYKGRRSEDAFTELVRRYTNLVYSVAKRHLPDAALAEEATQTVFLRLVKYRWSTQTDPDWRFSWDSTPAKPVLFWFEAYGYKVIRDLLLEPDGTEHEIVLVRPGK